MIEGSQQTKGDATDPSESVSLLIPSKAEYVALCRLVAGALGAGEGLDEEVIADLKVVVTEACNCFLSEPAGPLAARGGDEGSRVEAISVVSMLRLDILPTAETWEIKVSNPDRGCQISPAHVCDPMTEGGLALTIIRALVDSVEMVDDEAEGTTLRLLKKLSPEATPAE